MHKLFFHFFITVISLACCLHSHPVVADEDYAIGPNDVLTISVYDHDELKTTVRVSNNGDIIFPLINKVHVGGMKISAAAEKISSLLADGYIINPQVNIFVNEFKSKKVIVLGEIKTPGIIELHGPTSLLELISQAGGLTEGAGETIVIKREVNANQKKITIDLNALLENGDRTQNIVIKGGDTVTISKAGTCFITGEVKQPNVYPCRPGSTVLKMITLAGGFSDIASDSGIKIVRVINGEKKTLTRVELNTPVLPDDIIIVPESLF